MPRGSNFLWLIRRLEMCECVLETAVGDRSTEQVHLFNI